MGDDPVALRVGRSDVTLIAEFCARLGLRIPIALDDSQISCGQLELHARLSSLHQGVGQRRQEISARLNTVPGYSNQKSAGFRSRDRGSLDGLQLRLLQRAPRDAETDSPLDGDVTEPRHQGESGKIGDCSLQRATLQ